MADIAKFAEETIHQLDTTRKDVRIPRANLEAVPGMPPGHRREPQGVLVAAGRAMPTRAVAS